jgi:hypothetical protein
MTAGEQAATRAIDTSVAHPARRYNYWLGGKDHFAADRESGDLIASIYPAIVVAARENRAFLQRAVAFLTGECGISQFLDIGTGLPTADNTHEVAQQLNRASRVAYVDNDPMVMAHARALLTSTPEGRTCYIEEDLRHPHRILAYPELRATLDFDQPIALMLIAVLHFLPHHEESLGVVRDLVAALPAGSYVAASVATTDFLPPAAAAALEDLAAKGKADISGRSGDQFAEFFDGLDLAEPGIVPVCRWREDLRPPGQASPPPEQASVYAAVGRKT